MTAPIPNPTAFPRVESIVDPNRTHGGAPYKFRVTSTDGMTLRDHFAGQALAMLADPAVVDAPRLVAIAAYGYADAMLAERLKPIAALAPEAAPTYTEEQRQRAMGHLVGAYPTDGLGDAVDAVAEALGMRRAGA